MAIELDSVGNVQALNLPWVAKVQPVVWLLMLETIVNGLHAKEYLSTIAPYSFDRCCTHVCRKVTGMSAWYKFVVQ